MPSPSLRLRIRIPVVFTALTALMVTASGWGAGASASVVPAARGAATAGCTKPVTVTMFASQNTNVVKNLTTNGYTKYVEQKYCMNINWDLVPSTDVTTKESLQLESGNYPPVFLAANFTTQQVLQYGQEGLFVPLNSLLSKYAPNVMKYIKEYPEVANADVAPNGKIYALASYNYCFHCKYSVKMWINAAKLKEYGLSMPTTTAQFENVLEVFKQHGLIPLDGATIASGGWHSDPTNFLMDSVHIRSGLRCRRTIPGPGRPQARFCRYATGLEAGARVYAHLVCQRLAPGMHADAGQQRARPANRVWQGRCVHVGVCQLHRP